ncbi:restriction endonuclease, HNH endonuclease domain [Mycobacterium phage Gaia]|uniref:Restriction endonuclease, HNH endonuclease domain n=1 Tax=Mycobacterium phage Gaia TaxID=1486472 RepID=A0A068F2K5_9CAUD|nr:endonuclease VII [Mycobacterium phage Gaia]AID58959.1 restriction endonuclease, HNH endonuclease domain [Mycobacterium phage Gaia]
MSARGSGTLDKKCSGCQERKPLEDFYNNRAQPDGKSNNCRPCVKEYVRRRHEANPNARREESRRWRELNPEKEREAQAKWYASNRDKCLDGNLRRKYKLSLEGYYAMLAAQGGVCAIPGCDTPSTPDKRLHVDHDHSCCSGVVSCGVCVRALLCSDCNQALGFSRDDADRLRGMIDYLERWSAR